MDALDRGSSAHHPQYHPHGLPDDPGRLGALIHRRRALGWLAGAGTFALLSGCDSDGGTGGGTVIPVTPTPTPTPTMSPTPTPTPASCSPTAAEVAGPYPADGSNASSGVTNNILAQAGIVRGNIRPSFIGSTALASGVPLTLTITVINMQTGCAPVTGYAVYLWHADAQGRYSLYTAPGETYLRGVQATDATGKVTFTTIVPGCEPGRFPHMHVEVFLSLAAASIGSNSQLTTQLILPSALCSAVYADTATYGSSGTNFAAMTVANDNVFGDNTTAQNDARTLTVSGSVAAGYTAQVTLVANLGIAL